MRHSFKTFLGDSTLHLKVATSGDHVLILFGGDTNAVNDRIRHFSRTVNPEHELVRAIGITDGLSESVIFQTDVVKILGQIAGLRHVSKGLSVADAFRAISREVGMQEAPFVVWNGTEHDDRIFGASFEIDALVSAFDAFKGAGL